MRLLRPLTEEPGERIQAIADCVDTIALCVEEQEPGHWSALLGEMDQRSELHRLLWQEMP